MKRDEFLKMCRDRQFKDKKTNETSFCGDRDNFVTCLVKPYDEYELNSKKIL